MIKEVINQENPEVLAVAKITQKLWKTLNSDVSPVVNSFINQLKAIYSPQLKPVKVGGIIIEWVDGNTNETPWFS